MKNLVQLALLLVIASFILAACGGKTLEATEAPEASEANESARAMPSSLQTIEAASEDIIDLAPSGNWDKIDADVTEIANAWKSYQPQAGEDGASQDLQDSMVSALEKLQTALAAKDSAATMQGSNDVSAAVVEMFALYNPKIPVDIGRLDVLERQVILDVAAHDYSAAIVSFAQTKSVWEEVKLSVLEHNGKDVAAEFEASLAAQEAELNAKDDAALTNDARNGLEIVDALERLY
ncbi:MAG TPA: hypothetical protein VN843_33940 [Anaerolineales bacterium]|nr:hypothetical protein [Anaerolineales bacterium]